MRVTKLGPRVLTAILGAGLLITWAQTGSIVQGELSAGAQFGMALCAIGVCFTIGGQVIRHRPEP